ncbi:MAG: hypothetical protein OEW09_05850, partial [Anaerolineae bacterium]|nr:hypothetical protein [Anaerolineae bacterium]
MWWSGAGDLCRLRRLRRLRRNSGATVTQQWRNSGGWRPSHCHISTTRRPSSRRLFTYSGWYSVN